MIGKMRWLAAALLLTTGATIPAASVQAAKPTFTAPDGFRLEKDGTLIHEKSGTHFPLVYEGFARTNNLALEPGGKNISVVYNASIRGQPAEVRIALVHVLMMTAHEHFAALSPVVGSYFQSMKFAKVTMVEDGALAVPGLEADKAWQGRFQSMRKGQPYLLSLTTVDLGYWSARITAAYPQAQAADAQDRITKLIGEIRETGPKHH